MLLPPSKHLIITYSRELKSGMTVKTGLNLLVLLVSKHFENKCTRPKVAADLRL